MGTRVPIKTVLFIMLAFTVIRVSEKITRGKDSSPGDDGINVIIKSDYTEEMRKTGFFITEKIGNFEMVKLPGGTFMMGTEYGDGSKIPVHKVTVSPFHIGKYDVTQKQYSEIIGTNPSYFTGDDLPVEQVSWYDAVNFCNRLSVKSGLKPYYMINGKNVTITGGNGFRLPTEAEWEYACRGGTTTVYYWGNELNGDYCWHLYNPGGKTHSVGQKKPNAYGLYDMTGNVWQLCWDWYSKDPGPANDPHGPENGDYRLRRGGSWLNISNNLHSASGDYYMPYGRDSDMGFRLARSL